MRQCAVSRAAQPSFAESRKLGLELLRHRLRNIARAARPLLLLAVLPLIEVGIGASQTQTHCHCIDQHLKPVAQLDFGGTAAVGSLNDGGNILPVKDLIFSHELNSEESDDVAIVIDINAESGGLLGGSPP